MLKLLMIDDEKNVCKIVEKFFKARGYKVFIVNDPLKALPMIEQEHPQIILLDISMPEMNGLVLLRKIREIDKEVKVVMLTVVDDSATQAEAAALGSNAFVRKPFTTAYLEDVVMKKIEELFHLRKEE